MVCTLPFELLSYLICQTGPSSLLIRAWSYFFINESLTFFHILIKRNFIKKPIRETSLVVDVSRIGFLMKFLLITIQKKATIHL